MAKLKTGRHTSALKELRKSKKRREQNKSVKSNIKTLIRKTESAIKNKDVELSKTLIRSLSSALDKATKTKLIHKNAASNQKSRLSLKASGIK